MIRATLLLLLVLLGPSSVHAESLVLVHGYLGDRHSWEESGVIEELRDQGWQSAGLLLYSHDGLQTRIASQTPDKAVYRVELPSQAPLILQADWLQAALRALYDRLPDERFSLVGHSAGGVVARLALVRHGKGQVERLITIASPHLGTERALQALEATDDRGLLGPLKKWFVKRKVGKGNYHRVQQSRGVLVDLAPPMPGSLLFWLNSRQHPQLEYVSVVRTAGFRVVGDILVPPHSQDMNNILPLRGRSQLIIRAQGHELSREDASVILSLL